MAQLQEATIKAHCKTLRMPMIASQFGSLAEQAISEKKSHVGYLEALLLAEIEERERNTIERRIREAHLPRVKTLEEFDYTQSPNCDGGEDARLGRGRLYRARRARFVHRRMRHWQDPSSDRTLRSGVPAETAGPLHDGCRPGQRTGRGQTPTPVTARVMARWSRYDLIAIDEVGYVPLAEVGAEFLFQVVAERAERAAVVADHQPAVFRMDAGDSQRAAVQSAAGSHHRPGSHPGNRHGIVSIPPDGGEAEERSQTAD